MAGKRLKQERKRLKLKKAAFAALYDVDKAQHIRNEDSENIELTSCQLQKLAKAGVDTIYIMTGTRQKLTEYKKIGSIIERCNGRIIINQI